MATTFIFQNGEASAACIILAMSTLVGDGFLTNLAAATFFKHGEDAYYKYAEPQPGFFNHTVFFAFKPLVAEFGILPL